MGKIGEVLKMVYSAYFLQKHGINTDRSGAIQCLALHSIFLVLYIVINLRQRALAPYRDVLHTL